MKPHISMRLSTNILLILVWGVLTGLFFFVCFPYPFVMLIAGALLGVACGVTQTLSFRESKNAILDSTSHLEIRRSMMGTTWGSRSIYILWCGHFSLIILAIAFTPNPFLSILVGVFSLMFVRESITLKPTMEISRAMKKKTDSGA